MFFGRKQNKTNSCKPKNNNELYDLEESLCKSRFLKILKFFISFFKAINLIFYHVYIKKQF